MEKMCFWDFFQLKYIHFLCTLNCFRPLLRYNLPTIVPFQYTAINFIWTIDVYLVTQQWSKVKKNIYVFKQDFEKIKGIT